MSRVPKLHPCPDCGILIQKGKGPGGLSWHGCIPGRKEAGDELPDGRELLDQLSRKANLTPEEAATGLMRGLLIQMSEDPAKVPARAIGDVISGAARLAGVGGAEGGDDLLRKWLTGEHDESHLER